MRIVIIGAGPAGATLALALARHGLEVRLIERESSFGRVFRGEGLMPSGLAALDQLGLGDAVRTAPGRVVESWRILIDGDEVFRIPEPVDELGDRAFRVVSPAALLESTVARAQQHSGFSFHPGTRCTGLVRDDDGRVAGVRVAAGGAVTEHPADLVVGCDGRGSSVRTHAGLAITATDPGYDVVWFKAPPPPQLGRGCDFLIMVRGGRHPLIGYVSWDGLLQCGLIMPKGTMRTLPDDGWLDQALAAAPDWLAGPVREQRAQIEGPVRLNVMVGRAPSWSQPGLLLLGDAAHPMSPVRAQGVNLALRDVIVAANHLRPAAGRGPAALDAAGRAIQAEREPEIVRAQALQRQEARGQGDARSASWQYGFAKRAARLLGRYRWAQRAWLARQHDLRFGSTTVRLQGTDPAG